VQKPREGIGPPRDQLRHNHTRTRSLRAAQSWGTLGRFDQSKLNQT